MSDTHLGYRTGSVSGRNLDFARSWKAACQSIVDSSPDLIIHAGDLFHHANPSWSAVSEFLSGANILREANVPILMITGNHDYSRLTLEYNVFTILREMLPEITIVNNPSPRKISVDPLGLDVVLLSHRALLNSLLTAELDAVTLDLDPNRYSILVAHGDIRNRVKGEGSEEFNTVAIPESVFEYPWSYVALGHLHVSQPHTQKGWYSGSIERCGWSDYPASPGWTLTTISKTKTLSYARHDLPHRPMYQLPFVDCTDISDLEIYDLVTRAIVDRKFTSGPAILRVVLMNVSNFRSRMLRQGIPSFVKKLYPEVTVMVTDKKIVEKKDLSVKQSRAERSGTLLEMWKEFIETRDYPDEEFRGVMMDKGLEVFRAANEAMFESDTGDERSVAVE